MNRQTKSLRYKKVPALEKCFNLLDFISRSKEPLRIVDIANALDYNQSTMFNMIHTLVELGILEKRGKNRFHFGSQLYALSRVALRNSEFINVIHPFLESINQDTRLMVILGIRSGSRVVILDKVNAISEIQIASEVGMRIPLMAGAGGKALLSQFSDKELNRFLAREELPKYTPFSCVNRDEYRAMIQEVRKSGVAVDREEYIIGVRAVAVPLKMEERGIHAAIWIVGLKNRLESERIVEYSALLKRSAEQIEDRLSPL